MMLRQLAWKITHRKFKSSEAFFKKRTAFGEFNESIKFPAYSYDSKYYTLPFTANYFRTFMERSRWLQSEDLDYQYDDEKERDLALKHFDMAYGLISDRIDKGDKILDVGCSSGFFLEQFHSRGYTNLHGLDPQKAAVDYARANRPYINVTEGFFGNSESDVECDVLVFFQTIFRVPYRQKLFDAIDRSTKKYVLVAWVEDAFGLFVRDLHVGLAKKGFMCIEKRVVDEDFKPYGSDGLNRGMIDVDEAGTRRPNYVCYYLFRRITPRS